MATRSFSLHSLCVYVCSYPLHLQAGQYIQKGMARHAEYAYQRAPQQAAATLRRSLLKAVLLCVVAVAGGLCYMYTEAGWAKMQGR